MAVDTYALTTLAAVKSYLKIESVDADRDTLLEALIDAVSGLFETHTFRKLKARDYSPATTPDDAILDGSGGIHLMLGQYPVVSVTTLEVNGTEISVRESVHGYGYVIDKGAGVLRLSGYVFSTGMQNVEVTYRAGYETVPGDIAQACVEQTAWQFGESARGHGNLGLKAKDIRDGQVQYQTGALLSRVKDVLGYYKRRVVG